MDSGYDMQKEHQFGGLVRMDVSPNFSADGHPRSEENLARSSFSLIEALGEVGIVVHDGTGYIIQVNDRFCRMFGYTPGEVIGRELDPLVARGEELNEALALSELYCMSGRGFSIETTRHRKDGTPFPVLLTSVPMYIDRAGQRSVNTCTYLDLTGKRERERALRTANSLFENLFDRTPTAVVLCDIESRVVRGNPAFYRLFGYTPEEIDGQVIDGFVARGAYYEEARKISALVYGGKSHQARTVRYTKDGNPLDVTITAIPFTTDEGQKLLFGIYHDITAEKSAQRRIETYEAELRHLAWEIALSEERERHRIAGVLHDEIGFELASLYQSIGTLPPGDVPADFQKAASDSLRNAITQIRSLTREISNPALYAGGIEVGLRSLLDQLLTPADIRWKLVVTGSSRDVPEDLAIVIYQMVRELLRNVVKHAKAGSVSVRIRHLRKSIAVSVTDDGIGSRSQGRDTVGFTEGWGLFGIRERVKYLGGRMAYHTAPGRGTGCALWIPKAGGDSHPDTDLHR